MITEGHFADLDAATMETRYSKLTHQNIARAWRHKGLVVIHGEAGLGKTFAVEQALEDFAREDILQYKVRRRLDSLELMRALLRELTGVEHIGYRIQMELILEELLAERPRLIFIDEAQKLEYDALEMMRRSLRVIRSTSSLSTKQRKPDPRLQTQPWSLQLLRKPESRRAGMRSLVRSAGNSRASLAR
ncbi:MAG: hypothetical protein JWR63_4466 [Conexibacter sp.]|nr:hypothetical protein [Conexibacter sp.]